MLVVSCISFSILHFSDYCKQEMEVRTVVSYPEECAYDNQAVTEDVIECDEREIVSRST